jgi:hypothetical protein
LSFINNSATAVTHLEYFSKLFLKCELHGIIWKLILLHLSETGTKRRERGWVG